MEYREVAGKEHWWWDTDAPNDGGTMNDAAMRGFIRRCLTRAEEAMKTYGGIGAAALAARSGVALRVLNPGRHPSPRGGLRVLQQRVPLRPSDVVARIVSTTEETKGTCAAADSADSCGGSGGGGGGGTMRVSTANVRRFSLAADVARAAGASTVCVDARAGFGTGGGADAHSGANSGAQCFALEDALGRSGGGEYVFANLEARAGGDAAWSVSFDAGSDVAPARARLPPRQRASSSTWHDAERSPATDGGPRVTSETPFVVVAPAAGRTGGNDTRARVAMLRHYATYIANLHVMSTAARAPVVDDADFVSDDGASALSARHVAILVGGPAVNAATARVLEGGGARHGVRFRPSRRRPAFDDSSDDSFDSFEVGGCAFGRLDGAGLVAAVGAPGGGVHTLVAGTDERGERYGHADRFVSFPRTHRLNALDRPETPPLAPPPFKRERHDAS